MIVDELFKYSHCPMCKTEVIPQIKLTTGNYNNFTYTFNKIENKKIIFKRLIPFGDLNENFVTIDEFGYILNVPREVYYVTMFSSCADHYWLTFCTVINPHYDNHSGFQKIKIVIEAQESLHIGRFNIINARPEYTDIYLLDGSFFNRECVLSVPQKSMTYWCSSLDLSNKIENLLLFKD